MPITEFSNFTDGLMPEQRVRGYFVANVDFDAFIAVACTWHNIREAGMDVGLLGKLKR